jgi:hypothetical protein
MSFSLHFAYNSCQLGNSHTFVNGILIGKHKDSPNTSEGFWTDHMLTYNLRNFLVLSITFLEVFVNCRNIALDFRPIISHHNRRQIKYLLLGHWFL